MLTNQAKQQIREHYNYTVIVDGVWLAAHDDKKFAIKIAKDFCARSEILVVSKDGNIVYCNLD